MSLLDILRPSVEQRRAALRQAGSGRRFCYTRQAGGTGKKEKARLRKARYRAKNPGLDKSIEKVRAWGESNPEKARAAQARWAQENRDRINLAARNYRARQRAKKAA